MEPPTQYRCVRIGIVGTSVPPPSRMKIYHYILFTLTALMFQATGLAAPHLRFGPMMGHTTSTETNIWVKASGSCQLGIRIGEHPDLTDARTVQGPELTSETDFCGTVRVTGLKSATSYHYCITLNNKDVLAAPYPAFKTSAEKKDAPSVRFGVTSCLGPNGPDSAAAWGEASAGPRMDMMFLLGDNHYANSTDPKTLRAAYESHRAIAGFREFSARTPCYAIWDDHDYGPNDSDSTAEGKERSLRVFQEHWANPSYGEPDNPGIYYRFSRGEVDFFMVDVRYHRSPNNADADGTKTILGEKQMRWLMDGLKNSRAKVKFVASGSEWQNNGHPDSWSSFKRDQTAFFEFLEQEKIEGVILLSGDRHFTGGYQINGRIIEFTTGPFGSQNFPSRNLPEMFMNHGAGKMFTVLDVSTKGDVPRVSLEVYRAGQGLVERRDFTWDEINGRKKLALLPEQEITKPLSHTGLPLVYSTGFDEAPDKWKPTDHRAWRVIEQDGDRVYSLHRQSKYKPPHRSPINYSLVKDVVVSDFELRARVCTTTRDYGHRSMCLFFGYQDPSHFYYVHLGQEADDHANQIFIVNDAPRTKISATTTDGTPWDGNWHDVKITRNIESGEIAVFWDDMKKPVMTAIDKTFIWGQVGLGSFDDTGNWDDVLVFGTKASRDS